MADLPEQHAGFVVEDDGEVVGFALGQFDTEFGAELTAIHVLPECHGTGAGQALMDVVVDAFHEWGVIDALLYVLDGNGRAQAFYRRNGWRLFGSAGSHDVGGSLVPILEYRLRVQQLP